MKLGSEGGDKDAAGLGKGRVKAGIGQQDVILVGNRKCRRSGGSVGDNGQRIEVAMTGLGDR